MKSAYDVVLASKSKARALLLQNIGIKCQIHPSDFDERSANVENLLAAQQASQLALSKARIVSHQFPDSIIIGADQVLELDGEVQHKAKDLVKLREKLDALRGKTHALHSGVCLLHNNTVLWQYVATAHLTMRNFSDEFLDDYIQNYGENVLSSVGGYHYEGAGLQLMDNIIGDYYTILGMPVLQMLVPLRNLNILKD